MSDNYDIEKERRRVKELIKDTIKEDVKKENDKIDISNLKIINIYIKEDNDSVK
jgi:hypothetical protein